VSARQLRPTPHATFAWRLAVLALVAHTLSCGDEPPEATPVAHDAPAPEPATENVAAAAAHASPVDRTTALRVLCDAFVSVQDHDGSPADLLAEAEREAASRLHGGTPGVDLLVAMALSSPHERVDRFEAETVRAGLTEPCALAMRELRARAESEAIRAIEPSPSVAVAGFEFPVPEDWRVWASGRFADQLGERDVALAPVLRSALRPRSDVWLRALPSPAPECAWLVGEYARAQGLPAPSAATGSDDPCHYRVDVERRRVQIDVLDERVMITCDGDREQIHAVCEALAAIRATPLPEPAVANGKLTIRGPAAAQHAEFAAVIDAHADAIERCHGATFGTDSEEHGSLELSFVVSGNGSIAVATVPTVTSQRVKTFGHCLVRESKRWKFPAPKGGNALVKAPFAY
jgi:hypothetical protein